MFHLLCVEGPLTGRKLPVPQASRSTIGRQEGSPILLDSPRVSRKHAELIQEGDCLYLKDLGSQNGTYLNSQRVEGAKFEFAIELKVGDQLSLGDYIFQVGRDDRSAGGGGTALELPYDVPVRTADLEHKVHLAMVYGAFRALARARNREDFQGAMAALALKVLKAERVCLMDFDPKKKTLTPRFFLNTLASGQTAHFEPSMMVLHQIINGKETVFTVDASADPRFKEGASIVGTGVRSVICAPLTTDGTMTGAIYVDTLQSQTTFSQDDRHSLEALGDLLASGLQRFET